MLLLYALTATTTAFHNIANIATVNARSSYCYCKKCATYKEMFGSLKNLGTQFTYFDNKL